MVEKKHGGKRGGAGRPKGTAKEPTKVIGMRLPLELVETHKINAAWLLDAVMQKIGNTECDMDFDKSDRALVSKDHLYD